MITRHLNLHMITGLHHIMYIKLRELEFETLVAYIYAINNAGHQYILLGI